MRRLVVIDNYDSFTYNLVQALEQLGARCEVVFTAARYHSLIVERESLPACFTIAAWTAEGEIMGLRHRELAIEGVQFHPESFLTAEGPALLGNWLRQLPPRAEAARAGEAA